MTSNFNQVYVCSTHTLEYCLNSHTTNNLLDAKKVHCGSCVDLGEGPEGPHPAFSGKFYKIFTKEKMTIECSNAVFWPPLSRIGEPALTF